MRGFLNKVDQWAVKMFKFLRPAETVKSKVTSKDLDEDEIAWERERVVLPEHYYVTRTGQIMREPVKRKSYYKRYRMKK